MTVATDVLSGLLMVWFGLLFIGFKRFCGRVNFHATDDIQYVVLELLLVVYFVGDLRHWAFVTPMMMFVFLLWGFLQFRAHWLPFMVGATEERLLSYYKAFGWNLYILPKSRQRIVPDAYHTIQHALMLLNTIAVFVMFKY